MVASTHWLASAAGMAMIENGGNAADAAVAAGFVLQVVHPHLNGLGGEVPILVARPDDTLPTVICGQGCAPAAATIARFHELGLDHVPGRGLLGACVPGAFGGWLKLLRDWGRLSLAQVMAPAVDYATNGFPLVSGACAVIHVCAELFRDYWPSSADVYLVNGDAPQPGDLATNAVLADTYRRLISAGESAGGDRAAQIDAAVRTFYSGFVAEGIDRFCQTEVSDPTHPPRRGLLRGEDLASWRAVIEPPVTYTTRDAVVCKCGPWSQGPALLEQLAMLDQLGIDQLVEEDERQIHTILESAKLALADRDAWHGDPEHFDIPMAGLLDPEYARRRAALIGEGASMDLRPGDPDGRAPRLPKVHRGAGVGTAIDPLAANRDRVSAAPVRGDTCHVDTVDSQGMMVSATPSGGWLQSSPVIPELGFALGTRLQMTWLEEGLPSSLRPGARPRTTLTPTMVMRERRPWIAMGTPGGDHQDQWQLPVLLRILGGMDLQNAIDAPAYQTEHYIGSFDPRVFRAGVALVEARLRPETIEGLRERGHEVEVAGPWALGHVTAIGHRDDGALEAAASPRHMQSYAAGR